MTKVLKCNCKHEYQDKTYGKGLRIHNKTKKQEGTVYRCTACGNERRQS